MDKQKDDQCEEPEKRGKPMEEKRVTLSHNQVCKTRVFIPNVGIKRYVTEK